MSDEDLIDQWGPTKDFSAIVCRACGTRNDAITAVRDGKVPTPGAISICFHCASVAVLTEDMTLREPTTEEMEELCREPDFVKTIVMLQKVIYARGMGRIRPVGQN